VSSGLYVIELSNGHIKVGRSIDIERRMVDHARVFKRQGISIVRHERFTSDMLTLTDLRRNEERLILDMRLSRAVRHKNEIFSDVSFDAACGFAREAIKLEPYKSQ
jgi:predicted GIY-YIG superfamily endonuclease